MAHVKVGRYQLTSELGRGGMGIVYKALDPWLERELAIKVLPPKMLNQQMLERFMREARAVAKLDSPNIVKIFDIGQEPDGQYEINFIVMEFVQGCTLGEYFPQLPTLDSLQIRQRLELFDQILEAMDYAHAMGVIHRDLKPDNIMVTDTGRVKIMDFGLAFFAGSHSLTRADQIMGTVAYFSPEQAKAAKDIDHRADIYSLGVILFELLGGELPFLAEHPLDMMQKLLTEKPRSLIKLNPAVSATLEGICFKCLEKEPPLRYPTVGAFREALREYLQEADSNSNVSPVPLVALGSSVADLADASSGAGVAIEPEVAREQTPSLREAATAFDVVSGEEEGARSASPLASPPSRLHSLHPSMASTDWQRSVSQQKGPEVVSVPASPPDPPRPAPKRPTTGPSVYCQCGGENPPEAETCLECGETIKPSIYIVRREAESHYQAGKEAIRRGHLSEAKAELQKAVEQNREFGEAYLELGRVCLSLGDFEEAHESLDASLPLLSSKFEPLLALTDLYQQVEQPEDAIACLKEILQERPQEIEIRCRLALIYCQLQDVPKALAAYRSALRYDPEHLSTNRQLGLLLAAEGQSDEAIHYLEKVCRLDPRDAYIRGLLGKLYAKAGRLRQAEEMFVQALEDRREDPDLRLELGELYRRQGRPDRAHQELQRSLTKDPGHLGASRLMASLYMEQGQVDAARDVLVRAIRFHPEDDDLHRRLGEVFLMTGQIDGALECFEKVVELRPDCHRMRNRLGRLYLKKEYDKESVGEYREAVRLHPLEPSYREDLAMAHYVGGELENAASELHKAAKLDGRNPDYFKALGFIYLELGMADQAVAHFRWALHLEPNDAQTHGALGQALGNQGLANLAVDEFRKALSLDPSLGLLQLSLARALSSAGKHQDAVKAFREFASGLDQAEQSQLLSRAFLEMGDTLLYAGDLGQAAEVFQAALSQSDEEASARLGLAKVSIARSDVKAATSHLKRALELEPLNSRVWQVWSSVAAEQGDWSEAIVRMERAVTLAPEDEELWIQLGRAQRKAGRVTQAHQTFNEAAEKFPASRARFLWLRGRLAVRTREWTSAFEFLQRSLQLAPGSWRIHEDMAQACLGLQNWGLAREHIEKAAELAPLDQGASIRSLLSKIP